MTTHKIDLEKILEEADKQSDDELEFFIEKTIAELNRVEQKLIDRQVKLNQRFGIKLAPIPENKPLGNVVSIFR